MDQDVLEEMARVYMTDAVCKIAVERYMAEHKLGAREAAQQVAKRTVPAPHNTAAHDARYLLAPETAATDEQALEFDLPLQGAQSVQVFEQGALAQASERANEAAHIDQGPVPPHPHEAPAERERFDYVVELSPEQYELMAEQNLMVDHEQRGPLCELADELSSRIYAAGRIPVVPPEFGLYRHGESWRARLTVDTIPARNRQASVLVSVGTPERLDENVAHLLQLLEAAPTFRMVVRRSAEHVTGVIYMPDHDFCRYCGRDHSDAGPQVIAFGDDGAIRVYNTDGVITGFTLDARGGVFIIRESEVVPEENGSGG